MHHLIIHVSTLVYQYPCLILDDVRSGTINKESRVVQPYCPKCIFTFLPIRNEPSGVAVYVFVRRARYTSQAKMQIYSMTHFIQHKNDSQLRCCNSSNFYLDVFHSICAAQQHLSSAFGWARCAVEGVHFCQYNNLSAVRTISGDDRQIETSLEP